MKEIWKTIDNFENYQISTCGRIKNKKGEILKPQKNIYGYLNIILYKRQPNKKTLIKSLRIHRLVLENFKPCKNMDKLQVNHIDHDRTNNHLDNLEWTTPKENCNKKNKKEIFYNSIGCYDESGNYFNSYREAAKHYNISPNTVKNDCIGKTKRIETNYKNRKQKRMTFNK